MIIHLLPKCSPPPFVSMLWNHLFSGLTGPFCLAYSITNTVAFFSIMGAKCMQISISNNSSTMLVHIQNNFASSNELNMYSYFCSATIWVWLQKWRDIRKTTSLPLCPFSLRTYRRSPTVMKPFVILISIVSLHATYERHWQHHNDRC